MLSDIAFSGDTIVSEQQTHWATRARQNLAKVGHLFHQFGDFLSEDRARTAREQLELLLASHRTDSFAANDDGVVTFSCQKNFVIKEPADAQALKESFSRLSADNIGAFFDQLEAVPHGLSSFKGFMYQIKPSEAMQPILDEYLQRVGHKESITVSDNGMEYNFTTNITGQPGLRGSHLHLGPAGYDTLRDALNNRQQMAESVAQAVQPEDETPKGPSQS